ncbi:MAG: DEAD/DEAH box helicase [Treponema sp.]|jgi:ATP-dependent RNA helicase DeaD|nr:DEAD/DEAH box helicase [Treponema sp.]
MNTDETHPFSSFGLSKDILEALTRKGFTAPSSIQSIALPRLLADSGHLIVKARTGTGKTAAFGIPLVEKLRERGHIPRALILTPTRELALQVSREIASLASEAIPRITAVYGGASMRNQILALKGGTEIVVGTPGRVMDLMDRKILNLSAVDWFILDEADEMLDMGFIEDVEKVMEEIKNRHGVSGEQPPETGLPFRVALFSATMPEGILKIVRDHIGNVEILEDKAPENEDKPLIDQYYLIVQREDRLEALRRIIDSAERFYGLIFCATKVGADELTRRFLEQGYTAEVIHGDLSQDVRERTLRRFRARRSTRPGETSILVATDVAARGIDIEWLTHVVNWDLPNDRETYIHRIGRTGRAGRRGTALTLVLPNERGRLSHLSRSLERALGSKITWIKVPSAGTVQAALENRLCAAVLAAAHNPAVSTEAVSTEAVSSETVPAGSRLGRLLTEKLGVEGAVEALITAAYGELLDPARYGTITEYSEKNHGEDPRRDKRKGSGTTAAIQPGKHSRYGEGGGKEKWSFAKQNFKRLSGVKSLNGARVYVGLGRRQGAGAGDVARLLMRAGGIPGHLVDSIEMKDYCAFATLPEDAARRACAFSRAAPGEATIKPASPVRR